MSVSAKTFYSEFINFSNTDTVTVAQVIVWCRMSDFHTSLSVTGDNISMGGYISAGGTEIYVCVFAKSNSSILSAQTWREKENRLLGYSVIVLTSEKLSWKSVYIPFVHIA